MVGTGGGDWPEVRPGEKVWGKIWPRLKSWSSTGGGELGKRIKLA